MYQAAARGHSRVIEKLLDGGVNINMYDFANHIRFMWMYAAAANGGIELIKILLRRNLAIHAGQGRAGATAAKGAAKNGYVSAVKLLFDTGVKPAPAVQCAKKWKEWHVFDFPQEVQGKPNQALSRKRAIWYTPTGVRKSARH